MGSIPRALWRRAATVSRSRGPRNRAELQVKKVNRGRHREEHVYRALGRTLEGRYLAVFFVLKRTNEALVISARDMDDKERRSYAK